MSEKVNLLIRSALCNADSKIEAALDWTVLEVKKQIEKIWPSNPPPGDQRLVYAGKLLQDPSKLQDVLRMDDLGQPFIVHLVCRQLSPPPASSRSSTDGLRRRPNVPSPTASSSNAQASSQTSAPVNAGVNSPWMQSYDGQVTAVDQVHQTFEIGLLNNSKCVVISLKHLKRNSLNDKKPISLSFYLYV